MSESEGFVVLSDQMKSLLPGPADHEAGFSFESSRESVLFSRSSR